MEAKPADVVGVDKDRQEEDRTDTADDPENDLHRLQPILGIQRCDCQSRLTECQPQADSGGSGQRDRHEQHQTDMQCGGCRPQWLVPTGILGHLNSSQYVAVAINRLSDSTLWTV
jgi:hypothetical protein